MMAGMNTESLLDDILRREGGFVDHPADRGGPTNFGITQATLAVWRERAVSAEEVRTLSADEARAIYRELYLRGPGFDRIECDALRALLLDCAVNHGTGRAARWLQQAAGVTVDGRVGPVTLAAVNRQDGAQLYRAVLAERCRFYGRLITRDPSQAVFAAGWASRVAEFIEATPGVLPSRGTHPSLDHGGTPDELV
jgi:lysozyme family protein